MFCGDCCCISAVILLFIAYKIIDRLLRLPTVGRHADMYVLITGCDTGFGYDLTRRLDSLGCHVFAGCLTEKGETELRKVCSERLVTVSLDVSKPDSVRKVFQIVSDKLKKDGKDLWAVVNNAGIVCPIGPPEFLTIQDYRDTAAVNLYGLIDVTMTFLPLIKKSRGRVVNMSSIGGRISGIGLGPYCVTKYGVEAFSDGLRRSLRPYGCKVAIMEPGFHKTNIASAANFSSNVELAWSHASPEIKEEYGEEYFRYLLEQLHENVNKITSDKVSDVIDAYEQAILGRFPRARYLVGIHCFLFWIPVQRMPEWLGDWILDLAEPTRPLPAALKN